MNILASDDETGAYIFQYSLDDGNPIFEIVINGRRISHSVQGIESPSKYEWYCSVLGRQFLELHALSFKEGEREVQNAIKNALGM